MNCRICDSNSGMIRKKIRKDQKWLMKEDGEVVDIGVNK